MQEKISPQAINVLVMQFLRQHYTRTHALLDEIGLYGGQPPILHMLWENEGCTQTDLVENLHLAPATVTKMLQRMEQAGLVERRPDPVDQRITRVYLSPAGRAIRGDLQQREQQVGEEMLQDFRPEELAQLAEHLDRMRSNLLRINSKE